MTAVAARPIRVSARAGDYLVHVRADLDPLPGILARAKPSRLAVVTDPTVARLHGAGLLRLLRGAGVRPAVIVLRPGERNKDAANVARAYDGLLRAGCDRDAVVVAFGGGIVGDLAGFAAATFYRGLRWVQAPTTLLAQVDASIGGKTGYNLPEGKNLIGAFHPPAAVLCDVTLLATLPTRQVRAALAEVIKAGMIADARLLDAVERGAAALRSREPETLARVVAASARIKAEIVSRDEREAGARRALNFGHTVGHAHEASVGYGRILHGEAVALGMLAEVRIGAALGLTAPEVLPRLRALLRAVGLADNLDKIRLHTLADRIHYDKKKSGDDIRLALPETIGTAKEIKVSRERLARLLRSKLP